MDSNEIRTKASEAVALLDFGKRQTVGDVINSSLHYYETIKDRSSFAASYPIKDIAIQTRFAVEYERYLFGEKIKSLQFEIESLKNRIEKLKGSEDEGK